MLQIRNLNSFDKDVENLRKQGRNLARLFNVVYRLANEEILPPKFRDHPLKGNWQGYRDCHITFDWVLIYKYEKENDALILVCVRTGSHAELRIG